MHSYYQNANALLGLIAVALGIAAIAEFGQTLFAGIVLAVIGWAARVLPGDEFPPFSRYSPKPLDLIVAVGEGACPADQGSARPRPRLVVGNTLLQRAEIAGGAELDPLPLTVGAGLDESGEVSRRA